MLTSLGNAGTASREEVEAWWATCRDKAPGTRSKTTSPTSAPFYRWCRRWEHRDDDPTSRPDAPKVDKGPPAHSPAPTCTVSWPSSPTTYAAPSPSVLRRACASPKSPPHWRDVDLRLAAPASSTARRRSRLVALGAVLIDQILPDTGGNVVTGTNESMSAATLQRRINRAMKRAGVDATFHQLRHRYGTLAYQATRDPRQSGRQMGHSSPVTTAIYAAASDDVADAIAEAVAR